MVTLPAWHVVGISNILPHGIGWKIVATIVAENIGDIRRVMSDGGHRGRSEGKKSERSGKMHDEREVSSGICDSVKG